MRPLAGRSVAVWARPVLLGLASLVCLVPLLWTLLASMGVQPSNTSHPPTWSWPPSLDSYTDLVIGEPAFPEEVSTSLLLACTVTVLTLAVALPAGYALARTRRGGSTAQAFLVLATIPAMAYLIPLADAMRRSQLFDTFGGVALAAAASHAPLAVYILHAYLARLPRELDEAARLDGATLPQLLWRVVLPGAATGLAATGVLIFALDWNLFLLPLVLTLRQVRTLPIAMSDFLTFERELDWSTAAAALVVSLAPLVLVVAVAHRAFERLRLEPPRHVRSAAGATRGPRVG